MAASYSATPVDPGLSSTSLLTSLPSLCEASSFCSPCSSAIICGIATLGKIANCLIKNLSEFGELTADPGVSYTGNLDFLSFLRYKQVVFTSIIVVLL